MPQLPGTWGTVTIYNPVAGARLIIGSTCTVGGSITGRGMPEPVALESVTIKIGNQPPVQATIKAVRRPIPPPPNWVPGWTFTGAVQVPPSGSMSIVVHAAYDSNDQRSQTVSVTTVALGAKQPESILEIQFSNPNHPANFDAAQANLIAFGKAHPTPVVGGTFPSVDAQQEWKQVLPPNDADYEDSNLVGATGWALNPGFSGADVPFDHPFDSDWEFAFALDQPAQDPKRYTFLLTRGNQSYSDDSMAPSTTQAINLQMMPNPNNPNDTTPNVLPMGPDNLPSLLGVEIDAGLIPKNFTAEELGGVVGGDRIAVFGRWIVDCGHQIPITDSRGTDLAPGIEAFRSEIHPPLLMAAGRVTDGSLATGSTAGECTRVMFTSRPYLVGQRFTTDPSNAYDDNAADGTFVPHMANEIAKVNTARSLRVEAHPKIKSHPFRGANVMHFIIRPPPEAHVEGPPPSRLQVSFQFTVRSGCAVQVTSTAAGTIDVFIVMNGAGYTPPPLPKRNDSFWSREQLEALSSKVGGVYKTADILSAVFQAVIGSAITIPLVEAILNRDVLTDLYDTDDIRAINILDASHAVTADAVNIPAGQGVVTDDDQPYPVFGWLEARRVPLGAI